VQVQQSRRMQIQRQGILARAGVMNMRATM
jgi:hypothetical protein